MALNGLQIQKLLPKTNCKECGCNTCLAFAMKLAAKKAELSDCPYASEEAKAILGAASEPPVKTLTIGSETEKKIGGETVLYRHEKTFINETLLAINIDDTDDDITEKLENIRDYKLERVGEVLTINAVAVTKKSDDNKMFLDLVKKAWEITKLPLIIKADTNEAIEAAAKAVNSTNSIITGVNEDNADEMLRIAKENSCVLTISSKNVDDITKLTKKLKADGFNNLLMEFLDQSLAGSYQLNSIVRIAAIKDNVKELGYATLKYVDTGDELQDTVTALNEIEKYGGVCILPSFEPAQLVALMTLRLNIFTDPQKPIQVEPKVYAIGEPDRNSMVFVTTNFSLTYFIVSGEIENGGISAWLVIPECEGFSVLTAWAAGKFSGAYIAKFIKEIKLDEMVDTRKIIIPGYISSISGELEENLPGWEVVVGPQEAGDLESFIKAQNN